MHSVNLNQGIKGDDVLGRLFSEAADKETAALQKIKNHYAKDACPDQLVGRIEKLSFGTDFPVRVNIQDGFKKTSDSCVILILESPHKDEFAVDKVGELKPIGPAFGCTGCRIRKHFSQIFGNTYDNCVLVLLNTIRFQCSLGLPDVALKNRIVRACKKEPLFKDDLKRRINDVMERFSVQMIVNASGCVCEGFVDQVLGALRVDKKIVKRIKHPSRWGENTKFREI